MYELNNQNEVGTDFSIQLLLVLLFVGMGESLFYECPLAINRECITIQAIENHVATEVE